MKKITFLLASLLVTTMAMAQRPEAQFKRVETAPIIDGQSDDLWNNVDQISLNNNFNGESPSVGSSYFKAVYNDDGIYILVYVDDDVFIPVDEMPAGGAAYTYDHVEIAFDVNSGELVDGKGPGTNGDVGVFAGHYQFDPKVKRNDVGVAIDAVIGGGTPYTWAIDVSGSTYTEEFFIPFTSLINKYGVQMAQDSQFAFEVYIADRDAAGDAGRRDRKVWANDGTNGETWYNMDNCGYVTLLDPVTTVNIEKIVLSPANGTIDVNNGTLKITAEIFPENTTTKNLIWTVEPAGIVSITKDGVVKAIRNGEVTISAKAGDEWSASSENTVKVTITNQIFTREEANLIKNFDFSKVEGGLENWGVSSGGVKDFIVTDGSYGGIGLNTKLHANQWNQGISQSGIEMVRDSRYILSLKLWAAEDARPTSIDFEDPANNYNRFCFSEHEAAQWGSNAGRSEWHFEVTTEPTWYTFDVLADQVKENSNQKLQIFGATSDVALYVDSVYLVPKDAEYGIEVTGIKDYATATQFDVYPNPVNGGKLQVVLSDNLNAQVSIYTIMGTLIESKHSDNSRVTFETGNYTTGVYIVHVNNTVKKFVVK